MFCRIKSLPSKSKRAHPYKPNLKTATEKMENPLSESALNEWRRYENVNKESYFPVIVEAGYDEPKNIQEAREKESSDHWKQETDSYFKSQHCT